jgi:predicted enzyme related to lactoylglutathione lyase
MQHGCFFRGETPIHPDFAVEDLDGAIARATVAGAVQEGETCEAAYGRIAMFADPFATASVS